MRACFDSAIVIDFLNGRQGAEEALKRFDDRFVSVVTWIEVMAGVADEASERGARDAFQRLTVVELYAAIAEIAATIRRARRLKLPDAAILATARHLECQLVTRNTKDFDSSDPEILVPYTLS